MMAQFNLHKSNNMKSILTKFTLVITAMALSSCASGPSAQTGTAVGAVTGAVAGGIIGNNVGDGNAGRGALIGGLLGAGVGNAVGNQKDQQRGQGQYYDRYGRPIYNTNPGYGYGSGYYR